MTFTGNVDDNGRYGRFTAEQLGDVTVTNGRIIGVDNNIEFDAYDGSIGDINISFTATADEQALMTDIIFQAGYDGRSGRADAAEVSIGDITLKFTNPDLREDGYVFVHSLMPGEDGYIAPVPDKNGDWDDLAFFESTAAAIDADSGTGFAAEGNIGDVSLISSIYSGTNTFVDKGDRCGGRDNSDENIVLMRGTTQAFSSQPEMATLEAYGGIDAGIGRVGTGGASIGDVKVTARLEDFGPDTGTAGQGFVIAAGIRPSTAGVYASGEADDQSCWEQVRRLLDRCD